jgi:hypothetical protein
LIERWFLIISALQSVKLLQQLDKYMIGAVKNIGVKGSVVKRY